MMLWSHRPPERAWVLCIVTWRILLCGEVGVRIGFDNPLTSAFWLPALSLGFLIWRVGYVPKKLILGDRSACVSNCLLSQWPLRRCGGYILLQWRCQKGCHQTESKKWVLGRTWRKGNSRALTECKVVQLLQKTVWRFLQNFKTDSAVSLLDTYLKKMKILIWKDICALHVLSNIIHNS